VAVVLFSELNLGACFEAGNHGNLMGDAPEGSLNHTNVWSHCHKCPQMEDCRERTIIQQMQNSMQIP
jgi:hypothetical protein